MPEKPKYMDPLELKRRVKAGIKRRQADGRMAKPQDLARPDPRGAYFTKDQRRKFVRLSEIAVASLAQRFFDDWYTAIEELGHLMAEARFQPSVFAYTCKQIEHSAVEITGNKNLYAEAIAQLRKQRTKLISIPNTIEADNDSQYTDDPETPPRETDEREDPD